MSATAIEFSAVSKRYGDKSVVDDLSFAAMLTRANILRRLAPDVALHIGVPNAHAALAFCAYAAPLRRRVMR